MTTVQINHLSRATCPLYHNTSCEPTSRTECTVSS